MLQGDDVRRLTAAAGSGNWTPSSLTKMPRETHINGFVIFKIRTAAAKARGMPSSSQLCHKTPPQIESM